MHPEAPGQGIAQCVCDQPWPQVGAADADADDVGDVGGCQPVYQLRHARARDRRGGMRLTCNLRAGMVAAQGGVQCGAPFGNVDRFAVEQPLQRESDYALPGQVDQGLQRLPVIGLAREIEVQRAVRHGELAGARRVGLDQLRQRKGLQASRVGAKRSEVVVHATAALVRCGSEGWLLLPGLTTELAAHRMPARSESSSRLSLSCSSQDVCGMPIERRGAVPARPPGAARAYHSRLSIKRVRPRRAATSATLCPSSQSSGSHRSGRRTTA